MFFIKISLPVIFMTILIKLSMIILSLGSINMTVKINYNENEPEKIDEIINCEIINESSKDYFFRDAFNEVLKIVPKKNVETIVIG